MIDVLTLVGRRNQLLRRINLLLKDKKPIFLPVQKPNRFL